MFERIEVGPLGTNCYIIHDGEEALVIDPAGDADQVIVAIEATGAARVELLATHCHFDHVAAAAALVERYDSPLMIDPEGGEVLRASPAHAEAWGLHAPAPPEDIRPVTDGETLTVGTTTLRIAATPGHCPGSISLIAEGDAFVGDLVFAGSIGRTDFPGGDLETLLASARREILSLPDETRIHPGHGPSTTVGTERVSNPYLGGR